jgi:hypothetical protein
MSIENVFYFFGFNSQTFGQKVQFSLEFRIVIDFSTILLAQPNTAKATTTDIALIALMTLLHFY